MFSHCLYILYIVDNLVSNGMAEDSIVEFLINIIKVHSLNGVRQTIGTTEVLFGNSLSWLLNNTYILCVYWTGSK